MTDQEIAEAMALYGGSFVTALGIAFIRADAVNRERLRDAFPEIINEYARLAQMWRDREQASA